MNLGFLNFYVLNIVNCDGFKLKHRGEPKHQQSKTSQSLSFLKWIIKRASKKHAEIFKIFSLKYQLIKKWKLLYPNIFDIYKKMLNIIKYV